MNERIMPGLAQRTVLLRRLIAATMLTCAISATASAQEVPPERANLEATIQRGLGFLVKDALAWKAEHDCVSCHHAGLVIWSLHEAKQLGQKVDEPVLAELTKWVAESGNGKTSLPRPKDRPKAFNAKAVWLGLGLGAEPNPDAVSRKGLQLLADTVKSDQTENGSWMCWPGTRPPMFGSSDDSTTAFPGGPVRRCTPSLRRHSSRMIRASPRHKRI